MKAVAGVLAAGALAGAVAVSAGRGSAPLAAVGSGKVNPYGGVQEREEVFEFTQKPAVKKEGDKVVITFASKGKCDATVAIVAPDGKIVRHLASGVLGKNAPHPFQQNSLSQKIEWDGTDDQGKKAPGGCKVRVSLGLVPEFEMNIGYDPAAIPSGTGGSQIAEVRNAVKSGGAFAVAKGPGGELFVLGAPGRAGYQGRVFKGGKYVRTFWPVPAAGMAKLEQMGYELAETTWGDKVFFCGKAASVFNSKARDPRKKKLEDITKEMFQAAGITGQKLGPRPPEVPASKLPEAYNKYFDSKQHRMAVDRVRDELYIAPALGRGGGLMRIDGKTGKVDNAWFPDGSLSRISEVCVGPEGNVHISTGAHMYGEFVSRLTRDGKIVNFAGDAVPIPTGGTWTGGGGQYGKMEGQKIYGGGVCPSALKKMGKVMSLWTGHFGHSNTHERDMYVSPRGYVLHAVMLPDSVRLAKHGVPKDAPRMGKAGLEKVCTSYVAIWDKEGKLLSANAVGDMQNGHGVAMDADGNIYAAMGGRWPADVKSWDGIVGKKPHYVEWGGLGSLLKFKGGKEFPRGTACYTKEPPTGAAKLTGYRGKIWGIAGAEWVLPVLSCQTPDICTCHNTRYDMDYFARHWIPANQLHSVMVLDANGNRIARVGRYGNVDDADEKYGKIHFAWMRAIAVSDGALYVADNANRRILKAAIKYAAEEELPVP